MLVECRLTCSKVISESIVFAQICFPDPYFPAMSVLRTRAAVQTYYKINALELARVGLLYIKTQYLQG